MLDVTDREKRPAAGLAKNKKAACEPAEGFACGRQGVCGGN